MTETGISKSLVPLSKEPFGETILEPHSCPDLGVLTVTVQQQGPSWVGVDCFSLLESAQVDQVLHQPASGNRVPVNRCPSYPFHSDPT